MRLLDAENDYSGHRLVGVDSEKYQVVRGVGVPTTLVPGVEFRPQAERSAAIGYVAWMCAPKFELAITPETYLKALY